MAKFQKIETEIINILESIASKARDKFKIDNTWPTNRELTSQIKDSLREIGSKKEYCICGHKSEYPEWLYDIVWLKLDKHGHLIDSILVGESELNESDSEIDWDFQKLLLAKAKHKVMIFQKKSIDDIHTKMADFEQQVKKYKGTDTGERYLFAGLDWNKGVFEFKLFVKS